MKAGERAKLLKLRIRVGLHEAPYIVQERLGGTYEDALSLLVESAINKSFPADLVPKINQWNGKIIGPVEPSKSTVAIADLLVWLATLHVYAQLDSNAFDKDTLCPLGQAASSIASEKWPDTRAVLAAESWRLKYPGKPTPLLNGEESDRAFLAAMRHESQKCLQQAIDSLLHQKMLTLLDSTGTPTSEIQGAWVSKSELLQLIKEKKHPPTISEQDAPAQAGHDADGSDTVPDDETPEQRGDRLMQWHDIEAKYKKRGAVQRTAEREAKRTGKKVNRPVVGKLIKGARERLNEKRRQGSTVATAAPTPNKPFGTIKVIDGIRQK